MSLGGQLKLRIYLDVVGAARLVLNRVDVGDDAVIEALVVGVGARCLAARRLAKEPVASVPARCDETSVCELPTVTAAGSGPPSFVTAKSTRGPVR